MKRSTVAFVLALMTASAFAEDPVFMVSTKLVAGDELVASPKLIVRAGQTASVSVGSAYELSLSVSPQASGALLVKTAITMEGESAEPSLLVTPGKEAAISIGETTLSLTLERHLADDA